MQKSFMKKVLITGGTGLVGTALKKYWQQRGYKVLVLSRKAGTDQFVWDITRQYVDPNAFEGVETVVHLAGASVADKAWSAARRKELIDSRIEGTKTLANAIRLHGNDVKTVIAASAIGFYGFGDVSERFDESAQSGRDFLADLTGAWEQAIKQGFEEKRLVVLRIGIVLSTQGGALKEILKPVKMNLGAALGSGKQIISWIHIKDLVSMIDFFEQKQTLSGTYNAVAPNPVNNKTLTKETAQVWGKACFLPNVPAFVLKAALGARAEIVLNGSYVSADKIIDAGFQFEFAELRPALESLRNAHFI